MKPRRVYSEKRGRRGWRFRFRDPANGGVLTQKTFWLNDQRDAVKAFQMHMDGRDRIRLNLPDDSGWEIPYAELVRRFLAGAPLASEERAADLKLQLERNPFEIRLARDLNNIERLSVIARKLVADHGDVFVKQRCVAPTKQMCRWLGAMRILSVDPLASWTGPPRTSERRRLRALRPQEAVAVLDAADELDRMLGCRSNMQLIIKMLMVTGARPTALFSTVVADFDRSGPNIIMPPAVGKKANGAAFLAPELADELQASIKARGAQGARGDEPLLVGAKGKKLLVNKTRVRFMDAACLAFVCSMWPDDAPEGVEPVEVSAVFARGRPRGRDGAPPVSAEKVTARRRHDADIASVVDSIRPGMERLLRGITLYSLRSTAVSWGRARASADAVRIQIGHAAVPGDVEAAHYLDVALVRPSDAANAIWQTLQEARAAQGDGLCDCRAGWPQKRKTRTTLRDVSLG